MRLPKLRLAAIMLPVALGASPAPAEIALSSNDGHTVLERGKQVAGKPAAADTLSVIDLKQDPPRIVATLDVPGSVVGPPFSVAISRDESFAIVTSSTKADASGPDGISPDNHVSVIDLKSTPPKLAQTLEAGLGAASVRISPDGTLALVANRGEGTISIFAVKDRELVASGKLDLGNPKAGPSGLAFTRDGKHALVSRDGDSMVSVLDIEAGKVAIEPRPVTTAIRPYTMDINAAGTLAAVSNMGRGEGDIDSVSLIDLTAKPFRTVETVSVPSLPEGLKFSPDGKYLAVGSQEGTTRPSGSPFLKEHGTLTLFAVDGKALKLAATAPIDRWTQGFAFSRDERMILLQDMVERQIQVFRFDGKSLTEGTALPINGGPAGIATSWP